MRNLLLLICLFSMTCSQSVPRGTLFALGQGLPFPGPGMVHAAGGAASPTYKQECHGTGASTAVVSCVFGSNITAGSYIACGSKYYNGANSITAVADTLLNTYTLKNNPTAYMSAHGAMAVASSPSGGANTVAVTWNGTADELTVNCHEIGGTSGIDNNQTAMAGGEASGTNATTSGNITTTQNGDYIFAFGTVVGDTLTAGTSFTLNSTQTGTAPSYAEYRIQTSAGAIAGTFTPGGAAYWVAGVMAFKP